MASSPNLIPVPSSTSRPSTDGDGPNSAINGIHAAYGLLAVAWICVLMKLSLKFVLDKRKWKTHDYFAMLGLAFATAEVIVIGIDVERYGEGQHLATVPKQNLNIILRLLDHMYIMYEMALMFIKLSILSFYLAIFQIKPRFRYAAYSMMAFVVVYLTIFIFIDTFRCTPVKKMWHPVDIPGKCLDGVYEQRAFGIINCLTDIAILIMPFPILSKLHMSKASMISIGLIFGLGAFTCGAAVTRTIIIFKTLAAKDATWSVGPEITWLNVEMLVGLICGALLSSPALFRHILRETQVGQSLVSLLTRHSRESREPTPIHDPKSGQLRGKSTSSVSNTDEIPGMPVGQINDSNIGVQKTVDVSVETV